MTVRETLRRSAERLQAAGVESPRPEAEWLLAHVLGLRRMDLFLEQSRPVSPAEIARLEALLVRRESREPLQHLLGSAEFCGRTFGVDRHVLIPRPETELLAQLALSVLDGRTTKPATVLDFGTGSGCLAITVALGRPTTGVHAVDISPEALRRAQLNAQELGAGQRVAFHLGDGFQALPADLRFDLIVTNPPYIPTAEVATLEPEVRNFDPMLALDGGTDGLDFYRRLASEAPGKMNPGGDLLAEFGEGQGDDLRRIFEHAGWIVEAILPDDTGRDRMLHARLG